MSELQPGFHKCPGCGEPVPDERKELLGVLTCTKCTRQEAPPLGANDYAPEHHTDGGSGTGGIVLVYGKKPGRTST